tara:strand:+ start:280 stop:603 length:324 start_codon:yes stop_codon:yes gene_type:complete
MNYLIIIFVFAILVYAMSTSRAQERKKVELKKDMLSEEKERMSSEDVATYGQVQDRKKDLIHVIDANLAEHPEQSSQLKSIIEEWADLKIKAFENRRSWVRASGKNN